MIVHAVILTTVNEQKIDNEVSSSNSSDPRGTEREKPPPIP